MCSHAPAEQRSPGVLVTNAATGMEEHNTHDPAEPDSSLHEHSTPSSQAPSEPQNSPDTTPTVNIEAPGTNAHPEQSSPLNELKTMSSLAPAKPRLPFTDLDTMRTMPNPVEAGTQHSTEPVWIPQDSSRMQPPPTLSSPSASRVVQLPPMPSSPAFTSRLVRLHPLPDQEFTFPIMKLSAEIRLIIFDQLFLDLTVRRQQSMEYRNEEKLLQKHQVNDFRPYTNLLLTCKELNKEAKNHWDKYYLRECCFYFWHVSKLYDLAMVFDKMGKPYTEINYVLRSQVGNDYNNSLCLAPTVAELGYYEADWFIETQPGAAPGYEELDDHFNQRLYTTVGKTCGIIEIGEGTYEATDKNPVRVVIHEEDGRVCARGDLTGPESCAISVHLDQRVRDDLRGTIKTEDYTQMQGKFSGIFWGGYDAAVGYGKLKIWEAMLLDHLEGDCDCGKWNIPANRFGDDSLLRIGEDERLTLLNKWYDKIIVDPKWLALGGEPVPEPYGSVGLMGEYGMGQWLDDDYWRQKADDHWASWRMSDAEWKELEITPDLRPAGA